MRPLAKPIGPTVDEVARDLKRHPEHIRRLLRQGTLSGHKIGRRWHVDADSLAAYVGRPPDGDLRRRGLEWLSLVSERGRLKDVARLLKRDFGFSETELVTVLGRWTREGR
jgi:excisionase family DNA binding protein